MTDEPDIVRTAGAEFFDAAFYRHRYPETAELDPWDHFVRYGDGERRSPGPGFDAEFYAGTYLALEERNALRHYLTTGRAAGHLPVPHPADADVSRSRMAEALIGLDRPLLLVGNDAQRAGGPLLLLELAHHLRRRGWDPVFLLLRAGPLLDAHRTIGPTIILAEGHDLRALGAALPPEVPVVGQTGWAATVLDELAHPGPQLVLVHEMPQYLESEGLLPFLDRARTVVAGLPGVGQALAERLPGTRVRTVVPGLLHPVTGPAGAARVRALLDRAFGAGRVIVLGAGFADHRKGFDRFLDLGARLHEADPATALVWLGDLGAQAREQAELAIAAGLPLLPAGFRRDAEAFYDNADLYLLTSRQDPGPTTVIDAARRGVPFVAAPGDLGLRSLGSLLDGVGVFLDDDSAVPAAVRDVLAAESPDTRRLRSDHIEVHAGFPRYVDDLLELLDEQSRPPTY